MTAAMTETQAIDPLLFMSASLFIIGLGLICLRAYPWLMRIVFLLGKRNWKPATYTSLLKVVRTTGEEQFVMIFLIFTLAVGIFSARSARTLNANNDDRIQYLAGADLVFAEEWEDNAPVEEGYNISMTSPPRVPDEIVYVEPNIERFTGFDETESIAKVIDRWVSIRGETQSVTTLLNSVGKVRLMGIDTITFADTMWFRDDLLPAHINFFLNSLAVHHNGVLLSSNFKEKFNLSIGNVIQIYDSDLNSTKLIICGFVDYWPGYTPLVKVDRGIGYELVENYLLVANINYLNMMWGRRPYDIWMKTNTESNSFIYEFAYNFSEIRNNEVLVFSKFNDVHANLIDIRNDTIVQGTNGVLTVGFVVTLVLCFSGFLMYWILSIHARVLQFGIFRAMGMTMRNVLRLLLNEQVFITLTGIGIGAFVGEIASWFFVPLLQISYSASEQVIPLMITTEARDYVNLFTAMGFMVVICLGILGVIISKIKIAQALKLGED